MLLNLATSLGIKALDITNFMHLDKYLEIKTYIEP